MDLGAIASAAWEQLPRSTRAKLELLLGDSAARATKRSLIGRLNRITLQADTWSDSITVYRAHGRNAPPGLLYQVQIALWQRYIARFAGHAAQFAQRFRRKRSRRFIDDIEFDLSDPHNRGRTVLRLRLFDSTVWFYKPRPGRHEHAWQLIILAINELFAPQLKAIPVITQTTHCWMPGAQQEPCRNRNELERFYMRIGALLYLAHLLRAVDLHAQNFIACGEYPVLIDCETFLHPNVAVPPWAVDQPDSILRTGMVSVGKRDQTSLLARRAIEDHSAYVEGRRIQFAEMGEVILMGFSAMHECLIRRDRQRLCGAIDNMRAVPPRVIYRPTSVYRELLNESLSPRIRGSDAARRWLLHVRLDDRLCSKAIVRREVAQLARCDIPIFHGRAAAPRSFLTDAETTTALAELRASFNSQ
jgi:lantibiotic modifying enzyme